MPQGNNAQVIAVGGKGGVGKTAISSITTKLLLKAQKHLLIIDADPVISLAFSLGEEVTKTIGGLRERIIEFPEEKKKVNDRPIKDAIRDLFISSPKGFDLLVMGQAEGPGCFCGLNDLLRYGITANSANYDVTLVDCEAGIEQMNRRCVRELDQLLLVTDTSMRGVETASRVKAVANKYCAEKEVQTHLIVNRVKDDRERAQLQQAALDYGLNIIGIMPEDPDVQNFNITGRPLLDLPDNSPSVLAMTEILRKLQML